MTLRNKLIRLAHSKPELREHLLPLLSKKAYGEQIPKGLYQIGASLQDHPQGKAMVDEMAKAFQSFPKHASAYAVQLLKGFKGGRPISLEKAAKELGDVSGGQPAAQNVVGRILSKYGEKSAARVLRSAYDKAQEVIDEDHYMVYDDDDDYSWLKKDPSTGRRGRP